MKKNTIHPILEDATKRIKHTMRYVMLFSLASNIILLMLPIYSLQVLDRVLSSKSYETLAMLTLIAVLAFLFFGLFYAVRLSISAGLAQWLDGKIAPLVLSQTITRSSISGNVVGTQNMRDLSTVKQFIASPGLQTIVDAPWSPIFILIIAMIHPAIGAVVIVGAVILAILGMLTEFVTKDLTQESNEHGVKAMKLSDTANQNAEAVEAMGMMAQVVQSWVKANAKNVDGQTITNNRSAVISGLSKAVRMLIQVCVILTAAVLTMNNHITVGGMIASSILTGRALAPFEAAIGLWKTLITVRQSYARLNDSLKSIRINRGTMNMPEPKGVLSAEGLMYRAPGSTSKIIIKGVSFELEAGDSLGIIGPSGAGKSTLGKMLVGVWPALQGKVRLDGVDVFKWSREDMGKYVGYLPQQVELFEGTIRDNIARMHKDIDDDAVIRAAQMAGAHELILSFEDGYETEVGPGLGSLSHGQKQRVALARAFYGNPKLIVLDEPNSNLDGDGEMALVQAMQHAKRAGITTVVIAHKPALVNNVDKVMMLRGGVMEAFGKREEVLPRYVRQNNAAPRQVQQQAAPQVTLAK